jgi:intron-binding protein aquarius
LKVFVIAQVLLDPAQYHEDTLAVARGGEVVYESFNLLMRRRPEANNFKAVLCTIRTLLADTASGLERSLPDWLHDVILGYGDPAAANYKNLPNQLTDIDFGDTFVSTQHLIESFPNKTIRFQREDTGETTDATSALTTMQPPYRLIFDNKSPSEVLAVKYMPPPPGPFPENAPRLNTVHFTPVQVEAIRSGINPGLTLIVGPPGTGKTDVAVQIISSLYKNFPTARVLIVTHSNQALNDLFQKLMERDIEEHHLLRLGSGEADLEAETGKDFSKWGRVNHALVRRIHLLKQVEHIGVCMGVPGDVGYTCETAGYFRLYHVLSKIEEFRAKFKLPAPPKGLYGIADASNADGLGSNLIRQGDGGDATESFVKHMAEQRQSYRKQVELLMEQADPAVIKAAFPFPVYFENAPGGLEALFGKK